MSDRNPPQFSDDDFSDDPFVGANFSDTNLPDWLRGTDSDQLSAPIPPPKGAPNNIPDNNSLTSDFGFDTLDLFALDDLLDNTSPSSDPFEPTRELQSGISGISATPGTLSEPVATPVPDDDLPDWLRDMNAAPDPLAGLASTDSGKTSSTAGSGIQQPARQSTSDLELGRRSNTDLLSDLDWLSDLSAENAAPRPVRPPTTEMPVIPGLMNPDKLPDDNPFTNPNFKLGELQLSDLGITDDSLPGFARSSIPNESALVPFSDETGLESFAFEQNNFGQDVALIPEFAASDMSNSTANGIDPANSAAVSGFSFEDELPEPPPPPVTAATDPFASSADFDVDLAIAQASKIGTGEIDSLQDDLKPMPPASPLDTGLLPKVLPAALNTEMPVSPDMPSWMADMRPSTAPVALTIGDQTVRVDEQPVAQMSDQLRQLRDRARQRTGEAAETGTTSGVLAGISGAIAPVQDLLTRDAAVLQPPIRDYGPRAALLQQILENQSPALTTKKIRARRRFAPDRAAIFIILLALMIAPFFTSVFNVSPPPDSADSEQWSPSLQSGITALNSAVNQINTGARVILVLDYTVGGSAELDPLVRAVLRDLIARGTRPLLIPTTPGITLHIPTLIAPVTGANQITAGRWLPGGALGIRTIADSLYGDGYSGTNAAAFSTLLDYFSVDQAGTPINLSAVEVQALRQTPIFLFHGSGEGVRQWAEQLRGTVENPARVVTITTRAAALDASAYSAKPAGGTREATRIVLANVSGLAASTLYTSILYNSAVDSALSSDKPAESNGDTQQRGAPVVKRNGINLTPIEAERWQSIGVGTLGAVLVIILGLLLNALGAIRGNFAARRLRPRRRRTQINAEDA